jgi:V/A-type H+/Na+-transporting ATPase subunit G/H
VTRADTLLQIKDAEAKAAQTIKDAQEKQRAIVAGARRDAIKRIQDAEIKMKEDNEMAFANEKAKVGANKSELIAKGREEANQAKARSTSKTSEVRQFLMGSFDRSF